MRLVFSADALGDNAAPEALPSGWGAAAINDLMSKMAEITNDVADRAVDALRREVATFGLQLDARALAAIREPVLFTIAAGMRARIGGVALGRDHDPAEEDLAVFPDDDMHPYVEHTGVGLRERLRLILEPSDEPA
ncbi:MAG TPA: hypothetical protein VG651_04520 [Stellaceae bacterium]|nr:hypothetical protein [Stellaceae bacterium]